MTKANTDYLEQVVILGTHFDTGVTEYDTKLRVIQLWDNIVKTLKRKVRSEANKYWTKILNNTADAADEALFNLYDWLDCGIYESIRIDTNPFGDYPETKTASVDYVAKICYATTLKALSKVRKDFNERLRICENRKMMHVYIDILADLKRIVDTLNETKYNDYAKIDALNKLSKGISNKAPTQMKANGALHII